MVDGGDNDDDLGAFAFAAAFPVLLCLFELA